jgi:hypothetical protein
MPMVIIYTPMVIIEGCLNVFGISLPGREMRPTHGWGAGF